MNERIKELSEIVISQNESEWPDFREVMTGAGALYLHVFSEKFAELIVMECVEVLRLVPYCADDKPDFGDEVVFQEAVKQHFGVEE